MKKLGKILLVFALALVVTTGCGKKELKDIKKLKTNTKENVVKEQSKEDFTFTDTSLVYEDNTSIFKTKVTNTSGNKQDVKEFKIHVKDKDGNDIVVLTGFIGTSLEANGSTIMTATYGADITNCESIEYEVVR